MSSHLPVVSTRQFAAAMGKVGFVELPGRGKGSHVCLHRATPATLLTVPNRREIPRGTLRALIRQAGLTVEAFAALL